MDPDPYVFGPPGSGSVITCTNPDPDPSTSKKSKKTLRIRIQGFDDQILKKFTAEKKDGCFFDQKLLKTVYLP